MSQIKEPVKPVGQLKSNDFKKYPVWTWCENDEDESLVMPVEITEPLNNYDLGAVFILTNFELKDGTKLIGNISINLNNQQIYALEFYKNGEKFMFSGANLVSVGTLLQLSEWLKKSIEEITPLKYSTSFSFENGYPIEGELDLQDW